MSGRVAHRDRLRRKPTVELDEALSSATEVRRVRSSSHSPARMASTSLQDTKIARDFSIVTLEVDPLEVAGQENGNGSVGHSLEGRMASLGGGDSKLSEELFSWRTRNGNGGLRSPSHLAPQSSAASEDLVSLSSDVSDVSSFLSSEGGTRPVSTRRPASQRLKQAAMGGGGMVRDDEKDRLRNESIAVGVGLLLLFFFTYAVQYCARHGYIKIPDHGELLPSAEHNEL